MMHLLADIVTAAAIRSVVGDTFRATCTAVHAFVAVCWDLYFCLVVGTHSCSWLSLVTIHYLHHSNAS